MRVEVAAAAAAAAEVVVAVLVVTMIATMIPVAPITKGMVQNRSCRSTAIIMITALSHDIF